MNYYFDGTLHEDDPTYVNRKADDELFESLAAGQFCYVLSSRQTGKSSLRVRTMSRLKQAGFACSVIDVSNDAVNEIKPSQWYANLVSTLTHEFDLDFDVGSWYQQQDWFSPLSRFREFIESVLLTQVQGEIVIFIDEIDSLLSLPFPTDDFFALIRACHNKRVDKSIYKRLTFCLLGVATPSDLIRDKKRTPFNIGKGIELTRFTFEEARGSLAQGLAKKVENPEQVLFEVLKWTGGQPFLTQKVCQLVIDKTNSRRPNIQQLVQTYVIDNWENRDIPKHLGTIKDRLLADKRIAGRMLGLYEEILRNGSISADADSADMSDEKMQLRLSGLVAKEDEKLVVYNPIYEKIFKRHWIYERLAELRPNEYAIAFEAWVSGGRDDSLLLHGETMEVALRWKEGRSLSAQDQDFIVRSQELDRQQKQKANQILEAANRKAQKRILFGSVVLGVSLILSAIAGWGVLKANDARESAEQGAAAATQKANQEEAKAKEANDARRNAEQGAKEANKKLGKAQVSLQETQGKLEFSQSELKSTNQQLTSTKTQLASTEQQKQQAEVDRQRANQERDQALQETTQAKNSRDEAVEQADRANQEKQQAEQQTRIAQDERKVAEEKREEAILTTRLERIGNSALKLFESGQEIEALLLAMQSGLELQSRVNKLSIQEYSSVNPLFTLQNILDKIQEKNRISSQGNITFSFDKQFLAKPLENGTVRLWTLSGQYLATFEGDSVKFSPDGKHIATQSRDGIIRIFNIYSKQKITEFEALFNEIDEIDEIEFSPDGQQIVAILKRDFQSNFVTVGLWSLSGKKIKEFEKLSTNLNRGKKVMFSPDGNHLFLYDSIFNLESFSKCTPTINQDFQNRLITNFSPDGKHIITYNKDIDKIELWNTSCKQIQQFDGTQAQFSPDGQYLVTSWYNDKVKADLITLWDLSGQQLVQIKGEKLGDNSIVNFSPDSRNFSVALENHTGVEVWKLSEGKVQRTRLSDSLKNKGMIGVIFSPDGKYLAVRHSKRATLWHLQEQQPIKEFEGDEVFFSDDSQYFITQMEGNLRLFDISGKQVGELKGNKTTFSTLKVVHSRNKFITNYYIGDLRFWDVSGNHLVKLNSNSSNQIGIFSLVNFSPDGNRFFTYLYRSENQDKPKKIQLWDKFGNQIIEFNASYNSRAAFGQNNQHLIIKSDSQISIFNLSGQKLKEFDIEGEHIQLTPDGHHLFTISDANAQFGNRESVAKVQKWNLSGKLVRESKVQFMTSDSFKSLQSVEISPDAKYFAASIGDNKVRLWDLSGQRLKDFEGNLVKFSPDGKYLVTLSSQDNKIRVNNLLGEHFKEFNLSLSIYSTNEISFSSDGQHFAFLLNNKTIGIWNFETQQLTKIKGEQGRFEVVRLSPDGERLATTTCVTVTSSASCSRIIQLWDLSGRKLAEFSGREVSEFDEDTVVFSPDGKLLAVALDNSVKLWRVGGLDELLTRGCDWLEYYFLTHPEERKVCPSK